MPYNKTGKEAIVAYIIIALLIYFLAVNKGVINGFAFSGYSQNCGSYSSSYNLSCANQQQYSFPTSLSGISGGVVTSLSNIAVISNFQPFNTQAWLINFALNGAGQGLVGTWNQGQIATAINSSYRSKSNFPVTLSATMVNQTLITNYAPSINIVGLWQTQPANFNFDWFTQGCGVAGTCTAYHIAQTNNTFKFGCANTPFFSPCQGDVQSLFNAYLGSCYGAGGQTFALNQNNSVYAGIVYTWNYQLTCLKASVQNYASIFVPSTSSTFVGVNVNLTVGSQGYGYYITSYNPQKYINNLLDSQIYGYSPGVVNNYPTNLAPIEIYINPQGSYLTLSQQISGGSTVAALTQDSYESYIGGSTFPPGFLVGGGVYVNGQGFPTIYNTSILNSQINAQHNAITGDLQRYNINLAGSDPYKNMVWNAQQSRGYLNVLNSPLFYPNIQFIANVTTLALYIPVATPQIVGKPNYIETQGSSQGYANVTVQNNGPSGSVYGFVNASGSILGTSPNIYIPGNGGTGTVSIQFQQQSNQGAARISTTLQITVCSSQMNTLCSSATVLDFIDPNCNTLGSGWYYNSTTHSCQQAVHSCQPGQVWNGNACVNICTLPATWNTTTASCWQPPPPPSPNYLFYIVIIIIALIVAFGLFEGLKRR